MTAKRQAAPELLDADHAGKHRSDMITNWTDESAVNGYGGAS